MRTLEDGLRRVDFLGGFELVTEDPVISQPLGGVDLFRQNTVAPTVTAGDEGAALFSEKGSLLAIGLGGGVVKELCIHDSSFWATLPQSAEWIHQNVPDTDHDGVPDECDVCAGKDDKADQNGNGVPDCLDRCPIGKSKSGDACAEPTCGGTCAGKALNGDLDCDGVCDEEDNCESVPNAEPGAYQLNCNAESEKVHGAKVLGDACDPVPCPQFTAVGEAGTWKGVEICTGNKFEVWTCMTQFQLKELEFTPIGSSGTGEAPGSAAYRGVEVPVEVGGTQVRYCVDRVGVDCRVQGSVFDDLSSPTLGQETPKSIYWRTTVNGAPRTLSALGARTYERAQPAESVAWDYNQDFVTWAGAEYEVPSLDDAAIFGKKFSGRMWFHGDTSVGMAGGPADMAAKTGVHVKADAKVPADQLANHYVDMFPKLSSFQAGAVDGPWPPMTQVVSPDV